MRRDLRTFRQRKDIKHRCTDSYLCAIKRVIPAWVGRDAGPYHNMVAAGLRARHASEFSSVLASDDFV